MKTRTCIASLLVAAQAVLAQEFVLITTFTNPAPADLLEHHPEHVTAGTGQPTQTPSAGFQFCLSSADDEQDTIDQVSKNDRVRHLQDRRGIDNHMKSLVPAPAQ
jgi:hypothetical protein